MNFSQIKCFLVAAECLSFTRAAERLYLSQPVLSRQIAAMEDTLGMALFVREKKAIRLTPAGEILYEGLCGMARDYQVLVDRANAAHLGFSGTLNIGMIEGQLVCPPYAPALSAFHEKHPDIRVNLSRHTIAGMRRAILDGEIDIAFGALFNAAGEEALDFIAVGKAETMLVIPKTHPLAQRSDLRLSDFRDDTFLTLPEDESRYIAELPERIREHAFKPRILEAPDIGTLALWLEAGYGIFPLNGNHSLRLNPNLTFVSLPELADTIEVVMWRANDKNPTVALFIEQFTLSGGDEPGRDNT